MSLPFSINSSIRDVPFDSVYSLGESIGGGVLATVHPCTNIVTGAKYIAKIIPKRVVISHLEPDDVEVLYTIKHDNLLRLKEIYETTEQVVLVNDAANGGAFLSGVVSRPHYSEKVAANCIRQILSALKTLHDKGIVHRDLKPENIFYADETEDSLIKIADFGLSTLFTFEVQKAMVATSPTFCAPEVIMGKSSGAPADMFSVGVLAYILLSGTNPFGHSEEVEIYRNVIRCNYDMDNAAWDGITLNAKNFVRSLLQLDPAKRLTALGALKHPWISGGAASMVPLKGVSRRLRDVNSRDRFKSASGAVLDAGGAVSRFDLGPELDLSAFQAAPAEAPPVLSKPVTPGTTERNLPHEQSTSSALKQPEMSFHMDDPFTGMDLQAFPGEGGEEGAGEVQLSDRGGRLNWDTMEPEEGGES